MKNTLLLFLIFAFSGAFAQNSSDKITLLTKGKYPYEKNGELYKLKDYKTIFTSEEAKAFGKKAKTNYTTAQVMAFVGGASVGASIPMLLRKKTTITISTPFGPPIELKAGGPYGYGYTIIGVGIIAAALPLVSAAKKNAQKAVNLENGTTETAFKPQFKLETTGNGLALSYNF